MAESNMGLGCQVASLVHQFGLREMPKDMANPSTAHPFYCFLLPPYYIFLPTYFFLLTTYYILLTTYYLLLPTFSFLLTSLIGIAQTSQHFVADVYLGRPKDDARIACPIQH